MRLLIKLPVLISFLVLVLAGCSKQEDNQAIPNAEQAKTLEEISFRLAWVYDMAEVGVFVAKEKGFFEKEGLDVTIEAGGFGLDPIKLVATGGNDFGIAGAGNLLLARTREVPVVAIGAEFQNTPVGFITHKDSGITSFSAFRGKKVGVQTGSDTDVLYQALLRKNNMTSKDVVEVPIQYDMGPFVNGIIDVLPGYVTNQPIVLKNKGFETNVITAKSQGLNYYGNVFFTTEKKIKNQPDQVRRFIRAVRAGWQHALNNKEDAIASLHKYTKDFDQKDLSEIYDSVMPFIQPDEQGVALLEMTETKWKATWQVLNDAGLIKGDADIAKSAYMNLYLE